MSKLVEGQEAPAFTVETPEGTVALADLLVQAANGVVVYFYPRANTPGCTKEACDFRDNLASMQSAGYAVIGISPDKPESLRKFRDKYGLSFPLGADPDHKIMEQYGAWGTKKNYGKEVVGVIRSTVVVGSDGLVKLALYNVKATGHVARLRKQLGLD